MDLDTKLRKILGETKLASKSKKWTNMKYQQWIYNQSNRIIAISKNVKDEFGCLIPCERTVVIPNGILPPKVSKYPDHETKIINLCIVGRVEPNKNQLEAVKAVKHLIDIGITNIKLYIIGSKNSDYANDVCDYIDKNKLSDFIIMTGVRTDVNNLLCDMNIGLMLSKHEAFGRVTVEYMMHGLCVIASNTSANPEIINDGVNGLLYEYGDSYDLSNKILKILSKREMMKDLSKRGLNDALENYRSETNSKRVFDLYESIKMER